MNEVKFWEIINSIKNFDTKIKVKQGILNIFKQESLSDFVALFDKKYMMLDAKWNAWAHDNNHDDWGVGDDCYHYFLSDSIMMGQSNYESLINNISLVKQMLLSGKPYPISMYNLSDIENDIEDWSKEKTRNLHSDEDFNDVYTEYTVEEQLKLELKYYNELKDYAKEMFLKHQRIKAKTESQSYKIIPNLNFPEILAYDAEDLEFFEVNSQQLVINREIWIQIVANHYYGKLTNEIIDECLIYVSQLSHKKLLEKFQSPERFNQLYELKLKLESMKD